MISDYFKLAFSNLRHRGLRSWLTILGIFIGIAAVVSLISLGAGLQAAILGQFGSLSVDKLTIQNKGTGFGPPGSTVVEKLNENDVEIIGGVAGVGEVIPRYIKVGQLEYNGVSGFGYATNIPNEKKLADMVYESMNLKIAEGQLLEDGDRGSILMGNGFLDTEDFEKPFGVGKTVKLNGENFRINGFLEKSSTLQVNYMVFMLTSDVASLYDVEGEYDMIIAHIDDVENIESIAEEIERKMRKDRGEDLGEESFTVETPLQAWSAVSDILGIINIIVIGIAAISLFVGGVGIANTMYTSVIERTKEIGVMKAIGAQNKDVLSIFLIESGLLGLVGGVIGATIGLGIAFGASMSANQALGENVLLVTISWPLLVGAVLFSFFVGVLSGIFPAIQASRLNVVDALRK
ncbi:MAG: ABC transporter permease [Nanoarchaeota archaeon]|nr:ABC transporter permease [Nanoarchaeota archaeon]